VHDRAPIWVRARGDSIEVQGITVPGQAGEAGLLIPIKRFSDPIP